jgi:hypothetical protein
VSLGSAVGVLQLDHNAGAFTVLVSRQAKGFYRRRNPFPLRVFTLQVVQAFFIKVEAPIILALVDSRFGRLAVRLRASVG